MKVVIINTISSTNGLNLVIEIDIDRQKDKQTINLSGGRRTCIYIGWLLDCRGMVRCATNQNDDDKHKFYINILLRQMNGLVWTSLCRLRTRRRGVV